jgi:alkanesulfonate monooxygenase SsuD/methylene tetrahydromethanopterin reductase-like flavin-dependent oxidoreductase (luciferase family)
MKACWTEPEINFDGRFWQLAGAAMEPKPVQKPHPPVWIGGNHPAALARAVRLGDGFFGAGSQPSAAFAEQTRVVHDELTRSHRDRTTFQIAKRVYIHVDDEPARAHDQIEGALARHYGRPVPGVSISGPPTDCIAGLREVADAGADLILLNPLVDDHEQMERLATEVIPGLD